MFYHTLVLLLTSSTLIYVDCLLIACAHAMGRARADANPMCGAAGPGGARRWPWGEDSEGLAHGEGHGPWPGPRHGHRQMQVGK